MTDELSARESEPQEALRGLCSGSCREEAGRHDAARTGDDKTSIAFTVAHDRPGTLIGVLGELAGRKINLTRIESRPSREELGIYVFLIDFQGHREDAIVAEALAAVQERASYLRVLGSYPRFVESR